MRERIVPSVVYFIGLADPLALKVGWTRCSPRKHLSKCQTGCPLALTLYGWIEGGPKDEMVIHAALSELHLRGEWFRASVADVVDRLRLLDGTEHLAARIERDVLGQVAGKYSCPVVAADARPSMFWG